MITCPRCREQNPERARFCLACGHELAAAVPTEIRRVVTVLFCDLVGSTELAHGIDVERLRAVLARYFERMSAAVDRHGGRVEKFIGDAVLAVFGIPVAHEDDAVRACRAAMDMRAELADLNEELRLEFGITLESRTGINTGEVVAGDVTDERSLITGDAVNLAARLEQNAAPGTILLGEPTYRLVRGLVVAEAAPPVEAKGFGRPLVAYLLEDVDAFVGRVRRFDAPIVDRDAERAMLRRTFERVVTGRRCQLFTLLGPPGIGKSRLVDEVATTEVGEMQVLRGRCLPYGERITFRPVAEIVEQAVRSHGGDPGRADDIETLLHGALRADVVASRLAQVLGHSPGDPAPDDVFWATRRLLEELARERPVVLVFDDIHWAQPLFLDLIEHLADRSGDAPLALVCLARPDLLELRPSWAGGMLNATTVLLDPLGPGDTQRLLDNLLGKASIPSGLRERIVELAGGHPLFAEELVAELIDDGTLVETENGWSVARDTHELSLPATVAGLLAARIGRLPVAERAVLERASVIGQEFTTADVEFLAPVMPQGEVARTLESLVRKEMIRPAGADDAWAFRHVMLRDASYEGMAKGARADLHERFADRKATEGGDDHDDLVAHHLDAARELRLQVAPGDPRASDLASRAGAAYAAGGRRAAARGDMPTTVRMLERAGVLLPPTDRSRLETVPYLADGLVQRGDMDRALALLDDMAMIADRIGEACIASRARIERYTWGLIAEPGATSGPEFIALARGAVTIAEREERDEDLAAALDALVLAERLVAGDASAMLAAAERSLALALDSGLHAQATSSASNIATALRIGATPCTDALARLSTLDALLPGEPMTAAALDLVRASLLVSLDRPDEARSRLDEARVIFDDLELSRWAAALTEVEAEIAWSRGDPEAAEPAMRETLAFFHERGETMEVALGAADLALLLCDLGRIDDAATLADEVVADVPGYVLETQIGWHRVRARVLAAREALTDAVSSAEAAVRIARGTDFVPIMAGTLLDLAAVQRAGGRDDLASAAAEEAIGWYERKGDILGARRARSWLAGIA